MYSSVIMHYQKITTKMKHNISYNIFLTYVYLWVGREAWQQSENETVYLFIIFCSKP